jgi:putative component of toxin-antitoxin plasmid stabilization module
VNYEIIQLDELSGSKASIYSVLPEGEDLTLFDLFVEEYKAAFYSEVLSITNLLEDIGNKLGIREQLIKMDEGKLGDGVVALYDNPDKNLRLYGIRYGSAILVLGSGGEKSKAIRAWQEDKKLTKEAEFIIQISKDIYQRIQDKEIEFSDDYTELTGNLNFTNHDND